jgi:hypothetical protein
MFSEPAPDLGYLISMLLSGVKMSSSPARTICVIPASRWNADE